MCPSILLSVCSNYIYPYNSVKGMYLVVGGGTSWRVLVLCGIIIHTELCRGPTHPLALATGFCILRIVDNPFNQKFTFPPHILPDRPC